MQECANFNILLIDDEVDLGELCEEILISQGYNVKYFSKPEEVLSSQLDICDFHLIITDINMGTLNGLELYAKLNKNYQEKNIGNCLPVIFISGGDDSKVKDIESDEKQIYYLQKPFNINQFLNKVASILQTP